MMRMCLSAIVIINVIACFNQTSKTGGELTGMDSVIMKSNLDKKRIALMETVLNLPTVIRLSKIEFIRKKYGKVYILLEDIEKNTDIPLIMQRGKPLHILYSADSVAEDTPCYVFNKIEIRGDSANIRMTFDITGVTAIGDLKYTDGRWVPDKEFSVGVR